MRGLLRLILLALIVLPSALLQAQGNYPDEWWETVDPQGAPSWEILPQEANRNHHEVILSKRTSLGALSNFAEAPFVLDGVAYQSLEGFWQMMKYPESARDPRNDPRVTWPFTREEVSQMVAFEAKDAGSAASHNMETLNINWVTYHNEELPYRVDYKGAHYSLIYRATWAKVLQNENVRHILLQTAGLKLLPDHHQGADTPPAWKYYEILTEIREALLSNKNQCEEILFLPR